jgi:isopenicillin-N epimerase
VTPALATPAAIDFHNSLGGAALMARNAALAREAAMLLAQRWRTEPIGPLEGFAAMATVRLPLADEPSGARANALMRELSERHRISAAVVALGSALWVRVAAQAYNAIADYERLSAVFAPLS